MWYLLSAAVLVLCAGVLNAATILFQTDDTLGVWIMFSNLWIAELAALVILIVAIIFLIRYIVRKSRKK